MNHYKIESSNIETAGYDPEERAMEIVFKTTPDTIYHYFDVEPLQFCRLLAAKSAGSYFAKSLKVQLKKYEKIQK